VRVFNVSMGHVVLLFILVAQRSLVYEWKFDLLKVLEKKMDGMLLTFIIVQNIKMLNLMKKKYVTKRKKRITKKAKENRQRRNSVTATPKTPTPKPTTPKTTPTEKKKKPGRKRKSKKSDESGDDNDDNENEKTEKRDDEATEDGSNSEEEEERINFHHRQNKNSNRVSDLYTISASELHQNITLTAKSLHQAAVLPEIDPNAPSGGPTLAEISERGIPLRAESLKEKKKKEQETKRKQMKIAVVRVVVVRVVAILVIKHPKMKVKRLDRQEQGREKPLVKTKNLVENRAQKREKKVE